MKACIILHNMIVEDEQIMVLFREAFHRSHEGLDLSLQCGGSRQLISLIVVGGGHRVNEYHATLVSGKR